MIDVSRLMLVAALLAPQAAIAAGDATMGSRQFLQCRACHNIDPVQGDGVGPSLSGVVGRKAAARPDYAYSPAMAKSGITWTAANLDAFLQRPSALVPGTKMAFAGVSVQKNRDDLIAFLATLKPAKR